MGDLLGFNVPGTVVKKSKIVMIFNNKHFESLPYLLHLCALYCKTAVWALRCFF